MDSYPRNTPWIQLFVVEARLQRRGQTIEQAVSDLLPSVRREADKLMSEGCSPRGAVVLLGLNPGARACGY
jgi:hypothetical protein